MSDIQTIIGIDYGQRRTGVSVGNTLTHHAEPLEIIHTPEASPLTRQQTLLKRITELIVQWQVSALVIGIPRHPDGTAHEMTAACLDFKSALMQHTGLLVHEVDERYTSAVIPQSTRTNTRGQIRAVAQDDVAAAVILQQFLDSQS